MASENDMARLAARTGEIYDRHAAAFDRQRPKKLHERKWLDRFCDLLPAEAHVLDVGCGAAEPFTAYFLERGCVVEGVDFSMSMLKLARARFPALAWHFADMRTLELGKRFDGLIAWNSFFHLTPRDQVVTIDRFSAHLKPGGALMMTVGPGAGEVVGHVNGDEVYHSSLEPDEYREVLARAGIDVVEFVAEDPDCEQQSILIGRKSTGDRRAGSGGIRN